MIKICFVTTVHGTIKSFILDTAKYLHKYADYDITFICNENKAFGENLPQYIHFYPIEMKRGITFDGIKAICRMYKFFNEEKFDFVQYSTPNASLYASIAAKKAKIKCRLYCQWGIRYVSMTGLKRKLFRWIEKLVCKLSTDIWAVSKKNRQFAINDRLYTDEKAHIVGQGGTIGVDLTAYSLQEKVEYAQMIRQIYAIEEQDVVFGFVGRITAEKGCNELLAAFRNLKDPRTILLIIGSFKVDKDMDKELLAWAQLSPRVIFAGTIGKQNMPKYYAAMDVYVHPSYREGFGMALQEAAAMELAVITTNIPGASEVMEENISCRLVEPQNVPSLQSAMQALLDDQTERTSLGKAARKRVETCFERSKMLSNQYKDYSELVKKYNV